ncbi:UPF0149 family protein [Limimaricola cinnabarinus]|uniref:YecA family protein n=1 Tax=Limimaricola cinnabarinus TaxID=1125964 RepID=A0A2G1MDJ4_9RHOB|nr:UPF0149 family protein [Limimaricola cinnabarinus]PHP26804.1 hypothetical protein CJ301_14490 [Limimaricola cinnabarinus]
MLPPSIKTMLAALAQATDPKAHAAQLQRFGRALLERPDDAAALLAQTAESAAAARGDEERMSQLLGTALDEARMARENGQRRGALFIEGLETRLGELVASNALTLKGSLTVSGTWARAGLPSPAILAARQDAFTEAMEDGEDPVDLETLLDGLIGSLTREHGGNVSALHALFAEMLPTVPSEARRVLVRLAVARPQEIFAELGCAWLLDPDAEIRSGAVEGLSDRLAAGTAFPEMLARLTILRSWLADAALRDRLDGLVRMALRKGVAGPTKAPEHKLHRIVASLVDGSGAQSMAAAVQTRDTPSVAVMLLKQGFGVKDAYVLPCDSATEQRRILATLTDEIEAQDVPRAYMEQALGLALGEGLEAGLAPMPGLVDVAQSCGLDDLRPLSASVEATLALADPEGRVADLTVQARGRLITASQHWPDAYPVLESWFEDSDETLEALESAKSHATLTRNMWRVLEDRRAHWTALIARNALLLRAVGSDHAKEFIAVAAALKDGRDIKKTPVMKFICEQSIMVWLDRQDEPDGLFDAGSDMPPTASSMAPANWSMPDATAETAGELAKLLHPAGLTEPWLEGYLTGICTAPLFVTPSDWLTPLLHIVGPSLKAEKDLTRFVNLLMPRYNETLTRLRVPDENLIPIDIPLIPIWADGYLTAWEATKPSWPAKALGPKGKTIRKALEQATEGQIDPTVFQVTLPVWLRERFAEQKM